MATLSLPLISLSNGQFLSKFPFFRGDELGGKVCCNIGFRGKSGGVYLNI